MTSKDRVISHIFVIKRFGSMEPQICTKMLRNLREKLRAKFPTTTHGYSMVKIACLDDLLSQNFLKWKQAHAQ